MDHRVTDGHLGYFQFWIVIPIPLLGAFGAQLQGVTLALSALLVLRVLFPHTLHWMFSNTLVVQGSVFTSPMGVTWFPVLICVAGLWMKFTSIMFIEHWCFFLCEMSVHVWPNFHRVVCLFIDWWASFMGSLPFYISLVLCWLHVFVTFSLFVMCFFSLGGVFYPQPPFFFQKSTEVCYWGLIAIQ